MFKKTFALAALLSTTLIVTNLSAQTYLLGGLNAANITKDNAGNTEKNNTLLSFNAGFLHRFELDKAVNIETGLGIEGRGSRAETTFNNGNDFVKSTFNPLYVTVPVNMVLKITNKKDYGIFAHLGGYAGVGVAGKSTTESKIGIIRTSSEKSIQFNNDDPFTSQQEDASYNKLKRFDYGLNLGGGISFNKIIIRLNYGIGLAKINSTEANNNADDSNKFRVASLSIGFKL